MDSYKTCGNDVDVSTDICRSIPFYKRIAFICSNVDDICNEALQKPKICANLSADSVDHISMNYFQRNCVTSTKSLNRPVCMCDGGANRSVTNNISALHGIKPIPLYYIGGIGSGIQCFSKGW